MNRIQVVVFLLLCSGVMAQDTTVVSPPEQLNRVEIGADTSIFTFAETMPMFPGGELAFSTYLRTHLIYPETELLLQIQGTVYVYFVVNTDGSICNVSLAKGVPGSPDLGKEAMRVLRMMPNWIPGTMNGTKVRVRECIPVKFALTNQTAIDSTKQNISAATYVGGEDAMKLYLKGNMIYPDSAYDEKIEGTVLVRCIIEKDGSVFRPVLLDPYRTPRSLHKEALRLVARMPKWNPATQDGVAVRSGVTIPVEFKLPSKKEKRQQPK